MMPDDSPADFTQTISGALTPITTPLSKSSSRSSLAHVEVEGRFAPGTMLNGRYRIIALLGRGGMGEVYRATDLTLGQSVALKFLLGMTADDPRWLERFHHEVRIARQVSHPNVCRVYDIGEADGLPFISMEYVDGEDLSGLLRRIGRLPGDKALEISRKICAGLAAAHMRGVIHRDLKPHNIMLDRHGEVLICDFGLAGIASEIGALDIRQGTPAYMAPEQLKGLEVSQQSDIYALGLVLFELFTGKRPFNGANVNEILKQQEAMSMTSMSSLANDIDPQVETIIRRCLDPIPAQRPASALGVAAALPGGDPLAAALAAGQTPTPEMVAAGKSEGLRLRYSVPMLAAILIFLFAFPVAKGRVETMEYTPAELPPEALEAKSREMIAGFGYPAKAADRKSFFDFNASYVDWLQKKAGRQDWRKNFEQEPPLLFSYRQSPLFMPTSPDGGVFWERPSFNVPGMARLTMAIDGSLRGFEAIPPRLESAQPVTFDENKLFALMGLDRSRFREVALLRTPVAPFDHRVALQGPHPRIEGAEAVVQYSTFKGRLTGLYSQWPWSQPIFPGDIPRPRPIGQDVRSYLMMGGLLAFFFYSTLLAWRNWRGGRADRQGALRLALFRLILLGLSWVFGTHFVPDQSMFYFFIFHLSQAIFSALVLWQLYLALEPALRARWPQSIITWNRVLGGRLLDAQVGAHVLMGVAMGVAITAAFVSRDWITLERTGILTRTGTGDLGGTRLWLEGLVGLIDNSLQTGLVVFFTIFGLRVLLRREVPAILAAALLLTITNSDLYASKNPIFDFVIYYVISVGIMLGLVRFGTLTTTVAVFVTNSLGRLSVSTDMTAWFMPYSIATLLLIAAIAVFGFWRSLGNQELVGSES